jgi:hypothetical protein
MPGLLDGLSHQHAAGEKVFYYQYVTYSCNTAFNSIPLHLESTKFPTVQPRALNLSTRGLIATEQSSLIGGFIVTGPEPKKVMIRGIGPSLAKDLPNVLADPTLELHSATSASPIAANDNWQTTQLGGIITSDQVAEIEGSTLAPLDSRESAIVAILAPGSYTALLRGARNSTGTALIEVYQLNDSGYAKLANISTRGFVQTENGVMIGGFILGRNPGNIRVAVRGSHGEPASRDRSKG